jgi:hypothetical protein
VVAAADCGYTPPTVMAYGSVEPSLHVPCTLTTWLDARAQPVNKDGLALMPNFSRWFVSTGVICSVSVNRTLQLLKSPLYA